MLTTIFASVMYTFERVFQWFNDLMYSVDLDAPFYLLATMFMLFGVKFFIVPFLGGSLGGSDLVRVSSKFPSIIRGKPSRSSSKSSKRVP